MACCCSWDIYYIYMYMKVSYNGNGGTRPVPANHPKLDHFGIENLGFGDPPCSESPIQNHGNNTCRLGYNPHDKLHMMQYDHFIFFKIDVIEGMTIYEDTPSNGFGDP